MVAALLLHPDIDVTVLNNGATNAAWDLRVVTENSKTLNWVRSKFPPLHLAVARDKIDVLSVLLDHDRSLGYVANSDGCPLLNSAAFRGHVDVARELLKHCPDAPFCNSNGRTCLHEAAGQGQMKFVDFVLRSPQFGRLINMRNEGGDTALHLAVQKCNPKMVAALLLHPDIDVTVLNNNRINATWKSTLFPSCVGL
jgi:ankyrin repeat protein